MTRRQLLQLGSSAAATSLLARTVGAAPTSTTPPARPKPVAVSAASGVSRAERPLRILILGGTGFTGPQQVRYALARGHQITLFNRGRRPKEWPGEVEELIGDRETGDLQALAGRTWDACIDNPTSVPHWVRDLGTVLKGKVGQYVFISSVSAYAQTDQPGMTEDAPLAPYTGPDALRETRASLIANMALYGPLKAACEAEATKWFGASTTIVRPTLIVGPGDDSDRFTYWPVRLARGGEVLAPPREDPVQFIDARDLAEWTIRLVEQRAFGAFNGVGPAAPLAVGDFLAGIRDALDSTATLVHADNPFLVAQKIRPWADLPAWVPGAGQTAGFSRVSNVRAVATGLTFRPLATTARDTLAFWNSLPAERRAQPRAGLSAERETDALAAWRSRSSAT